MPPPCAVESIGISESEALSKVTVPRLADLMGFLIVFPAKLILDSVILNLYYGITLSQKISYKQKASRLRSYKEYKGGDFHEYCSI